MIDWPEIADYLSKGDVQAGTRPIREGRAILKSIGLVAIVNIQKGDGLPIIEAHCLQSTVNEKPHKIVVHFKVSQNQDIGDFMEVDAAVCSCTAASGKCKHIAATLMYLEKTPLNEIDTELSPTDLKQKWGQSKEIYTPKPLKQFCCIKEQLPVAKLFTKQLERLQISTLNSIENSILEAFPNSAFKLQKDGRRNTEVVQSSGDDSQAVDLNFPIDVKALITSMSDSISMDDVSVFPIQNAAFNDYFNKYIKIDAENCCKIFDATQGQDNVEWHKQRQVRITGSVAHQYLTYMRNKRNLPRNWNKKVDDLVFSDFHGTEDTKYGTDNEPVALQLFQKQTPDSEIVTGAGIIVNEKCPWFGYSADGFEITNDNKFYLLEVKCPKNGKTCSGLEQLEKCTFLKSVDAEKSVYQVKNSHNYYTQMQFGMMLMNVEHCKLIIYSEKAKSVQHIMVPYNSSFCKSLFADLTKTYFDYLLPFYYENKDKIIISRKEH